MTGDSLHTDADARVRIEPLTEATHTTAQARLFEDSRRFGQSGMAAKVATILHDTQTLTSAVDEVRNTSPHPEYKFRNAPKGFHGLEPEVADQIRKLKTQVDLIGTERSSGIAHVLSDGKITATGESTAFSERLAKFGIEPEPLNRYSVNLAHNRIFRLAHDPDLTFGTGSIEYRNLLPGFDRALPIEDRLSNVRVWREVLGKDMAKLSLGEFRAVQNELKGLAHGSFLSGLEAEELRGLMKSYGLTVEKAPIVGTAARVATGLALGLVALGGSLYTLPSYIKANNDRREVGA